MPAALLIYTATEVDKECLESIDWREDNSVATGRGLLSFQLTCSGVFRGVRAQLDCRLFFLLFENPGISNLES